MSILSDNDGDSTITVVRVSIPPSVHIGSFLLKGNGGSLPPGWLQRADDNGRVCKCCAYRGMTPPIVCVSIVSVNDTGCRVDTTRVLGGTACTGRLIHAGVRSHATTRQYSPWCLAPTHRRGTHLHAGVTRTRLHRTTH